MLQTQARARGRRVTFARASLWLRSTQTISKAMCCVDILRWCLCWRSRTV